MWFFFLSLVEIVTFFRKSFLSLVEIVTFFRKSKGMRHLEKKWLNLKELHYYRHCFVKQKAACIINVWGYTEILPPINMTLKSLPRRNKLPTPSMRPASAANGLGPCVYTRAFVSKYSF